MTRLDMTWRWNSCTFSKFPIFHHSFYRKIHACINVEMNTKHLKLLPPFMKLVEVGQQC